MLKRHRSDDYLLTHALDGWSLAMDFKVTPQNRSSLWALCDEMTELVLEAGGRFYFAKDLVLGAGALKRFVPTEDMALFQKLKGEMDPAGILQSDQSRRVFTGIEGSGPMSLTDF